MKKYFFILLIFTFCAFGKELSDTSKYNKPYQRLLVGLNAGYYQNYGYFSMGMLGIGVKYFPLKFISFEVNSELIGARRNIYIRSNYSYTFDKTSQVKYSATYLHLSTLMNLHAGIRAFRVFLGMGGYIGIPVLQTINFYDYSNNIAYTSKEGLNNEYGIVYGIGFVFPVKKLQFCYNFEGRFSLINALDDDLTFLNNNWWGGHKLSAYYTFKFFKPKIKRRFRNNI